MMKGATEAVLSACSHVHVEAERKRMNKDKRKEIEAKAAELAMKGLRVLSLAYRPISEATGSKKINLEKVEAVEQRLTFIGLVGIMGPLPCYHIYDSLALEPLFFDLNPGQILPAKKQKTPLPRVRKQASTSA